jgi:hypothetical protein
MSHSATPHNSIFHQELTHFHFPIKEWESYFEPVRSELHLYGASFECRSVPGRYWLVFDLIPVRPAPDTCKLL